MIRFTVLKTFHDPDLKSDYVAGMTYTIRARAPYPGVEGDKGVPLEKTPLYAKLQDWLKDGRATLADVPRPDAGRMRGEGVVETLTPGDVGVINAKGGK